jgi:hypothetical protein
VKIRFSLNLCAVIAISGLLFGVIPYIYSRAKIEAAQGNIFPKDLPQKVREKGVVNVIVDLNFPWKPLADLSPAERIAQQQAIIVAQDQLLAELTGTQYTLIHRFIYNADLVLDVGPAALAVLGNSTLVQTVAEDIPDKLHRDSR